MISDATKIKLVALTALLGLGAAIVVPMLRNIPATYGVSVSKLTSPYQVSTTSYTPSPSSSGSATETAATTSDTTTNWAGYVSTGGSYSSVSGSWTVPTVAASDEPVAADATWIGIGGEASDDLIQIGTQNAVESGQVTTGTFYERLPDTSETVPGVNVNAGDSITASVKEASPGEWTISIDDVTNGESYSNMVAYDSSESSAEWIEEAPSSGEGVMPLDDFGPVAFTNGATTENGKVVSIGGSNAQALTMDDETGEPVATTSALDASGGGFTVNRASASSDDSYGQYYTIPGGGWTRHEPGRDAWGHGYYAAGW